jgi:hypothetical protein
MRMGPIGGLFGGRGEEGRAARGTEATGDGWVSTVGGRDRPEGGGLQR